MDHPPCQRPCMPVSAILTKARAKAWSIPEGDISNIVHEHHAVATVILLYVIHAWCTDTNRLCCTLIDYDRLQTMMCTLLYGTLLITACSIPPKVDTVYHAMLLVYVIGHVPIAACVIKECAPCYCYWLCPPCYQYHYISTVSITAIACYHTS